MADHAAGVLLFLAAASGFCPSAPLLPAYCIATAVGFVALWLVAGQGWTVAVGAGIGTLMAERAKPDGSRLKPLLQVETGG